MKKWIPSWIFHWKKISVTVILVAVTIITVAASVVFVHGERGKVINYFKRFIMYIYIHFRNEC